LLYQQACLSITAASARSDGHTRERNIMDVHFGNHGDRCVLQVGIGQSFEKTYYPGDRTNKHIDYADGVVVVLEGEVFQIANGETTILKPGDILIVKSGGVHIVGNAGPGVARTLNTYFVETLRTKRLPDDENDVRELAKLHMA